MARTSDYVILYYDHISSIRSLSSYNRYFFWTKILNIMVQHLFLCVLLCILGFQVKGHPQCLDSLAPFRRKNHVCRDYRAGRESCCYFADEKRIRLDAKKATANYCSSNQRKACRFMLKRVLCTECSPWANHIYDGTPETSNGRQFPSLCHGYCRQFYNICYDIIFDFFGLMSSSLR